VKTYYNFTIYHPVSHYLLSLAFPAEAYPRKGYLAFPSKKAQRDQTHMNICKKNAYALLRSLARGIFL